MSIGPTSEVGADLRDGTRVVLRPVVPGDRDELRWGIHNLSPTSRYRRFFSPVSDLSERQLDYFTEIDYRDHFAWGALLADSGDPHPGLGIGRYIRLREQPDSAEFAIVVLDDWQGRGCGTLLLGAVLLAARHNRIERAVAQVLRENDPMLSMLRNFGAELRQGDPGELEAVVDLARWERRMRGAPWDGVREVVAAVSPAVGEV